MHHAKRQRVANAADDSAERLLGETNALLLALQRARDDVSRAVGFVRHQDISHTQREALLSLLTSISSVAHPELPS